MFGHLVLFMASFHLTDSDTWAHARALGSKSISRPFFIELFVFEQQVLFHADFLSVISYLRAHDPVWGLTSKSRTPFKELFFVFHLANHLSENIHIWAFRIIYCRLPLDRF